MSEIFEKLAGQTTLTNASGLTGTIAQIEQAGAANPATGNQFNLLDSGVMVGKGLLYANTMRDLAYGIAGIHGAALTLDNHTLENLHPLFISFKNANMHLYVVSRTEIGEIVSHLFLVNSLDYCAHNSYFG